ncbi:hypothetical protein Tco_0853518, partial [Tanacetum coccineum]
MSRSRVSATAGLVDTDTESDPEEAPSEAEESQPLGSRVPLMSKEFEASEPSGTRTVSSHSLVSSDSTAPLSPDHPLTHVSPTLTPTEFHSTRYRSSYETSSASSPALLVRMRYRGTSSEGDELRKEDTKEDEEDKSSDADDERERKRERERERKRERESQGLDDEVRSLGDE